MNAKTVVLTFDDAVANHATLAGPLLQQYGFGATFFVCEFPPDFATNKQQYMTWEQIAGLNESGFEIANHTLTHANVTALDKMQFEHELAGLEQRFKKYGITRSSTFAYPGGPYNEQCFPILRENGYKRARTAEARAYVPAHDNPMAIPSFPVHGEDKSVFYNAVAQAAKNVIPVLMFHGLPEYTHPWVNTKPEDFAEYMRYLADNHYNVIAMRDLPSTL